MTLETEISKFDKELENAHGRKIKRLSGSVLSSTTSSTILEVIGMWGTATFRRRLEDLDRLCEQKLLGMVREQK